MYRRLVCSAALPSLIVQEAKKKKKKGIMRAAIDLRAKVSPLAGLFRLEQSDGYYARSTTTSPSSTFMSLEARNSRGEKTCMTSSRSICAWPACHPGPPIFQMPTSSPL